SSHGPRRATGTAASAARRPAKRGGEPRRDSRPGGGGTASGHAQRGPSEHGPKRMSADRTRPAGPPRPAGVAPSDVGAEQGVVEVVVAARGLGVHVDVLDLAVGLEAEGAELAPDARLLVAAEGPLRVDQVVVVDPDG